VTRRHLIITGRVQNVFYRDWFTEQAIALGLDGWIRNRADGSVEAVVQGPSEMVETIIAKAHQGSPASRVAGVAVEEMSGPILSGFEQRPTA
jgi:acylphosphatase